jgi:hypothetical protein
MLFEAQALNF